MALFLRGNVWWMEYRTRKVRAVKSTRLRREDKAKAVAVYAAWRLGFGAKPPRSVVEQLLDAIYSSVKAERASLSLSSVWAVYEDWLKGKRRTLSRLTLQKRRNGVAAFVAWAEKRGVEEAGRVTVALARQYVASFSSVSNKTVRNRVADLATVWEAVRQVDGSVFDPWKAAMPDDDGSSVRLEAFSSAEEARVLSAAKAFGHGWWLASVISRWTGLRYGDVANLDWADVDLERRVIDVVPGKTRKHGVSVLVPMSDALYAALSSVPAGERTGLVLPEHAVNYPRGLKNEASFSRVLAAAGLDAGRYTFHSWRHTFRTRLADAGVSDEAARRLGGWTNLGMAAHYDHSKHLPELRAAISAMQGRTDGLSDAPSGA